jgi:hypothetical protein
MIVFMILSDVFIRKATVCIDGSKKGACLNPFSDRGEQKFRQIALSLLSKDRNHRESFRRRWGWSPQESEISRQGAKIGKARANRGD